MSHAPCGSQRYADELDDPSKSTVDMELARLFREIDTLAPMITAGAAQAETDRRIAMDIQQRLMAAGFYRIGVPKRHGGLELDLPSIMDIVQRLARIDGSVGWIASVRGVIPLFASHLDRDRCDAFYRAGPNVTISSSSQPAGTVEAVGDAWQVKGRWPFASCCNDADWIVVLCRLVENGQPVFGENPDLPLTRFAMIPKSQVQIEDSWYAMGLKATDSHHIVVENVLVPSGNIVDLATARSCVPGGLYESPFQIIALIHNAVVLGIAEAALEDILTMAHSGRRQLHAATAQKDSEIFQYEIARVQAELYAAQAYSDTYTKMLWARMQAGTVPPGSPLPETVQAVVWVTETCRRIVRACFELGGGSAIYDWSPLQRRLRDVEAAAQHALVQRRNYGPIGASLLAGGEPGGTLAPTSA